MKSTFFATSKLLKQKPQYLKFSTSPASNAGKLKQVALFSGVTAIGAVTYSLIQNQTSQPISTSISDSKPSVQQPTSGTIPAAEPKASGQTLKPKQERLFTKMIREAAQEQGLIFEGYSGDWIVMLRDPKTNQTKYIWGYKFGLNSQASAMLCDDKSALSDILQAKGVPHLEHQIFLNPGIHQSLGGWVPTTGVFNELIAYGKKHNFNVVLKQKDGTAGIDVFHCTNQRDIEKVAISLFGRNYSLVASPFERIDEEFRVVMLDNEPRLIFKKERPSLVADGRKNIRELLAAKLSRSPQDVDSLLNSDEISKNFDLARVPPKGELVPILWKHNLGGGAKASVELDPNDKEAAYNLAVKAAEAIGIRFASVDVVKIGDQFKVLEINSGVMMEKAPTFLNDGERIAKAIYGDAIRKMFEPTLTEQNTDTVNTQNTNQYRPR